MCDLKVLPPLRDVIREYGLNPKKSLGQNFLLDQNITDKIIRTCGDISDAHVIEIGPGPGGLTRSILKAAPKSVTAVEFDDRAIKALQPLKLAANNQLNIIQSDALDIDVTQLCPLPRMIIANLPYNIATPLLVKWLAVIHTDDNDISGMTLMFQKEVAERITARMNTKHYGRLAILSQFICNVKIVYHLPPSAFTPPPKVNSAVVQFTAKKPAENQPAFKTIETLTAAAFGNRRKMIRSSMKPYLHAIETCGIDSTLRAENLSVDDFVAIAKAHIE